MATAPTTPTAERARARRLSRRFPRGLPQPEPGSRPYAWCLRAADAAAVALLAVAGYITMAYLVNAAMVAMVVVLCTAAGWLIVEVRYRAAEHRAVAEGACPPPPVGAEGAVPEAEPPRSDALRPSSPAEGQPG